MWGNDCDYKRTLIDANHCHEISSYEAKKKTTRSKVGKIQGSELWIFKTWR
jgi:hypothetical protein